MSKESESSKGGDVIFQVGQGYAPEGQDPDHGNFIWRLADGKEILRIDKDGKFSVEGYPIQHTQEVYQAFSAWLAAANISYDQRRMSTELTN